MSVALAIETGDVGLLPSRRDEDWRWTDLRGLIRVAPPASTDFDGPLGEGPFAALAETTVTIVNGRGPPVVNVTAGDRRVLALRIIAAPGAGSHACRLAISVGEGASLTLLESYEGQGTNYLASADLDISLAPGARLERIVLAADAENGVNVSTALVVLGAGASLAQTTLTNGARRQRLETRVSHPGHGASVRLDGLYLLSDRRHADLTTIVTHQSVDGVTDQLTKGVADDQGRGVFQGRIVVAPGADRTAAKMGHHALILSDRAEIDAKPELEIFADDVACAHGNTVGALDEEALFYTCQRGVPESEARALLMGAFLGEVLDRVEHDAARDVARAWLADRLGVDA